MGSYLESLERVARLDPELVLPGHGPPFRDGARRAASILAEQAAAARRRSARWWRRASARSPSSPPSCSRPSLTGSAAALRDGGDPRLPRPPRGAGRPGPDAAARRGLRVATGGSLRSVRGTGVSGCTGGVGRDREGPMTEQAAAAGAVATTGARHRVVVIGGGFGGLNAVRELADADADVTVVDRTNHHLFQPLLYQVAAGILPPGLIAPALRQHRQGSDERPRAARRGDEHRPREARGPHRGARRAAAHPGLRHAGRRGRGHALLLRPRRVRRVRARYEDHRGRPVPARPDPVGVRDRRAVDGPGRAGRAADLRGDRGRARPVSRRSGRSPSWRTPCCRATTGRSTPARRGSSCWRARPRCCRRSTRSCRPTRTGPAGEDGGRDPPQLPGRRHGRRLRHGQGPGRGRDDPLPHPDLGGGRRGVTAGEDARRAGGRRDRPRGPHPGQPRLHRWRGIRRCSRSATWCR